MAHMPHITSSLTRLSTFAVATVCSVLIAVTPAGAQGHHARLSADLSDHLSAQSATIDVIVHGTRAEVDALAAKYNVVVRKYLKAGAVLRVNAGQLSAIDQDDAVDHLSGDTIIRSKAESSGLITIIGAVIPPLRSATPSSV